MTVVEKEMRGATVVFALLVAATLAAYQLRHSGNISEGVGAHLWLPLLLLALGKVYLIFHYFMEIAGAPARLRGAVLLWLVVVGTGIAIFLGGAS